MERPHLKPFDPADFLLADDFIQLEREGSASSSSSSGSQHGNHATYDFTLEREDALVAESADWSISLNDMRLRVRKTVGDTVSELSSALNVSYSSATPAESSSGIGRKANGEGVEAEEEEGEVMHLSGIDNKIEYIPQMKNDSVIDTPYQHLPPKKIFRQNSDSPNDSYSLENIRMTPSMVPLVGAYFAAAAKSLASSVPPSALAAINTLPMKISGFDTSFGAAVTEGVKEELSTHVGLLSLSSAVMFIGSIRGLNSMKTAKQGNYMGMVATAVGLLSVLASPGFGAHHFRFLTTFLAAGGLGYGVAQSVAMEDMPQLVAGFHSFVGLAAMLVGFANHFGGDSVGIMLKLLETFIGVGIGSLTFTGSVIAAGKLHGSIPGRPMILENRWLLNGAALLATVILGGVYVHPAMGFGTTALMMNAIVSGFLGVNMVLPVGGADMPVVVSLLNSFSGIATSAAGFMLGNDLLTITGALVASSGALLSDIMCKGINRSLGNVLLGGFGTDGTEMITASSPAGGKKDYTEVSHLGACDLLLEARKIVIVPGYGLAVARAQQKLAELVDELRAMKKTVHFAIHPVAGRLPGHMNVLLAEANVPYEIVREMDEVNDVITSYDLAIVIGANDIVNPATQTDPSSPIYGMPALEVWKCKKCIVMKRSMATGYSGVENPLFYLENVRMLFGDAKTATETVQTLVHEKKDQAKNMNEPESEEESPEFHNAQNQEDVANLPPANKIVGVLNEAELSRLLATSGTSSGNDQISDEKKERRVAVTPNCVMRLRKLGYEIILEEGAGELSGYPDQMYLDRGGVTIVQKRAEIFEKSNVIVQVTQPLPQDLAILKKNQTLIGIWGMYQNEHLLEKALENPNMPSVFNMALIPRISRAQALDVLSSMANIAGYRAVLDAFQNFPKFAKPSSTASGSTPPAKVFIIGAGVAGLSAIATAHALGAKVYASDVRSAAKEQVEAMGAEFVEVSGMIQGEGAGGYAKEMDDDFKERQAAMYAKMVKDCDIVISTALIPGRPAPTVITEKMVSTMRPGSVIVDLAALNGGNCPLTEKDATIRTPNGITIIGKTNYPSEMAPQASDFLARNFVNFLEVLQGSSPEHDMKMFNLEDQVIRDSMTTYQGQTMFPPPRRDPPPVADTTADNLNQTGISEADQSMATSVPPGMLVSVMDFISDHQEEIAMLVGMGVVLGLGLGTDIPQEEITHLGYFVLSLLIGHFTVASVTPALHTPLIAVTNAISGIIVVGGMLQLGGPMASAKVASALLAVFFSSVNIVGGFAVTHRMLEMFKSDSRGTPKSTPRQH